VRTLVGTNFGVYGAYWMGIAAQTLRSGSEDIQFVTWLRVPLAVYTAFAWVSSLFVSRASTFLFTTLEAELVLLIAGALAPSDVLTRMGGWFGVTCALSGFYTCASLLLRLHVNIPLGAPFIKPFIIPKSESTIAILVADDT